MSLLHDEFRRLCHIFPGTGEMTIMRDGKGWVYAIHGKNAKGVEFIFCAKASMSGQTVSVHEILWREALRRNLMIIMSIKNVYHYFEPKKIADGKHWFNIRNGIGMVNFSMKLGTEVPLPKPPEPPGLFDSGPGISETARSAAEAGQTQLHPRYAG